METSYDDPVKYPHVPEFNENIILSSSSSATLEDSMHTLISNNVCLLGNYSDNKSSPERTGICCSEVLKEQPTIEGSTDTLVSEMGATVNEPSEESRDEAIIEEICDALKSFKPAFSVSTSTSDLPSTVENVSQAILQNGGGATDFRLPNWSQNILQAFITNKRNSNASNSCSCSYTTPNHSRTPSSGFPATPCDDPSEMSNYKNAPLQMLDVDGINIIPNAVQERIKKIILHYKVCEM